MTPSHSSAAKEHEKLPPFGIDRKSVCSAPFYLLVYVSKRCFFSDIYVIYVWLLIIDQWSAMIYNHLSPQLGKPHWENIAVHLGIAQIAIGSPPALKRAPIFGPNFNILKGCMVPEAVV